MSIRYSYPIYFSALLLLLAACTQDELTDDTRLPEGQYPLEIARITLGVEGGEAQPWGAPATRVSENGDGTGSVFSAGDRFAVQIDGEEGIYIVQDNNTVKAEAPLYWTNTTPNRTVSAWYPATDGTLDLGDQSQSLAYLLGGSGTGDYQTPVTLTFAHRLAKVRVTPTGDALGEVQSLQLYTYTQCTYEKGTVVQGSQEGWIEMKKCEYTENGNAITCWEANVVPGYTITKLQANGTEVRELSSGITPVASKFYNITLNYDPGYTTTTDDQGQTIYNTDNEKGLKNLAKLVNEEGKTDIDITLTGDIALTGEWTPIGTESQPYTGTFDGGNHTITGLKINQSGTDNVGLIGYLGSEGKVQNVVLANISVSGANCVGGIAGSNYGTISGCSAEGTVTGSVNVGGIAGGSYLGVIIDGCHSTAAVSGSLCVGGVVGNLGNNSFLMACYSTGNVTATSTDGSFVGGVVGINSQGTVTGCYHATGEITSLGRGRIGGIVGENYIGTVAACYWDSNLSSGTGSNNGKDDTHKVDGPDVTWQKAVAAMNTALQSAGSGWHYELNGALPTLEEKNKPSGGKNSARNGR